VVSTHVVSAESSGERLDHVLRHLFPHTPRRVLLLWLAQGWVKLDGRYARKSQLVATGQQITVTTVEPDAASAEMPPPLSLLFENSSVVVLDKPAGQPSTSLEGGVAHSVAAQLLHRYPEMTNVGHGVQDAGLIHRLDTGTSGVIVAAKTNTAFETLTAALRSGELSKSYLAWTRGTPSSDQGSITLALRTDPRNHRRVIPALGRHQSNNRTQVTHYEVVGTEQGITLIRLHAPVATRHQIRAHLASVGCPLVGDELYGGAAHPGLTRHALHALHVSYRGAAGCNPFDCTSLAPDDVRALTPGILL
jgi:23S rRNA pseudouridine1911/1915/1917 synthase